MLWERPGVGARRAETEPAMTLTRSMGGRDAVRYRPASLHWSERPASAVRFQRAERVGIRAKLRRQSRDVPAQVNS